MESSLPKGKTGGEGKVRKKGCGEEVIGDADLKTAELVFGRSLVEL